MAAIGQCGENLVRGSNVMCDRSHSAGGVGSVMGSKNLKAIGIIGTGSVKIEATKVDWKELVQYQHTLMGANSGGVVPKTFSPGSRTVTTAVRAGRRRRAFTGAPPPRRSRRGIARTTSMNSMGLRTYKGYGDFGPGVGDKHTVKMNGCHACPVRCHIATDVPALEAYGFPATSRTPATAIPPVPAVTNCIAIRTEDNILASQDGVALCDDYGWWSDYGLAQADYKWMQTHAMTAAELTAAGLDPVANLGKTPFQIRLTAGEFARVHWAKFTGAAIQGKVEFLMFLIPASRKT